MKLIKQMVFPNMTSKKRYFAGSFAENQYRMELAVVKSTRINPGTNTNMALMAPGH